MPFVPHILGRLGAILLMMILPVWSHAQVEPHLYLTKVNRSFRVRYFVHDRIRFKVDGQDYFTDGPIEGFTDSSFYIYETEVPLRNITEIDVRSRHTNNFNYEKFANPLFIAGTALPLLDLINNGSITPQIAITSIILVSGGGIIKLMQPKSFRPKSSNKMVIIR